MRRVRGGRIWPKYEIAAAIFAAACHHDRLDALRVCG